VSRIALALLVVTALLGALRAFARRGWTASLRWLAVAHTALALVPLAGRVVHPQAIFLLWIGAFGGPAFILAGELAGASPRRGRLNTRLWRLAGWVSTASLAWPALAVFTMGHGWLRIPGYLATATAVGISTWIMVGRLEVAPERRRVMRPGSGLTAGRIAAIIVTALGPAGLLLAWWYGFEPHGAPSILALAPAVLGGLLASTPRQRPLAKIGVRLKRVMDVLRLAAAWTARGFSRAERMVLGGIAAIGRTAMAPLRDLHTGDAQEYLLLLAGVAVLALLLPLLR
jgi:hypothetical protein